MIQAKHLVPYQLTCMGSRHQFLSYLGIIIQPPAAALKLLICGGGRAVEGIRKECLPRFCQGLVAGPPAEKPASHLPTASPPLHLLEMGSKGDSHTSISEGCCPSQKSWLHLMLPLKLGHDPSLPCLWVYLPHPPILCQVLSYCSQGQSRADSGARVGSQGDHDLERNDSATAWGS